MGSMIGVVSIRDRFLPLFQTDTGAYTVPGQCALEVPSLRETRVYNALRISI